MVDPIAVERPVVPLDRATNTRPARLRATSSAGSDTIAEVCYAGRMPSTEAAEIIETLALSPHPEGGWYRETYRQPSTHGGRDASSAILFLLDKGERSHWHRVDAVETWFWHAGSPLRLTVDHDEMMLGGNVLLDQMPQAIVPAFAWQCARADQGWALVSCVVTPAFEFAGFELAAPDWTFS